MAQQGVFTRFSNAVSTWTAKPATFVAAAAFVVVWALTGPLFQFSETWQLVINTSTTIITFLMVFILQNSQNRDGRAIQAKLDELILTSKAENEFIGVENLDEEKIRDLIELLERKAREKAGSKNADTSGG